jgi:N-methylhydantoinase A
MKRVGIDIGGTFTDIVAFDEETGAITRSKTLSTPHAPEEGFLTALELASAPMKDVRALIHGTTIVTNLILERKGARVALITTRGYRDVLEIMRATRPRPYDLMWRKPEVIVPRHFRLEVNERVDARGRVIEALDHKQAELVIEDAISLGVEGIAICLIHSYLNDAHELQLEELVRRRTRDLPVSLSSKICREIREYERTSTTVVNVYAIPRVSKYVAAIGEKVDRSHVISYLSSEGGLQPSHEAAARPISLCVSGPAGGVLGGNFVGQLTGRKNLITIDMGGTSFDVAVIRDGQFEMKSSFDVEWGMPVRTPTIDIKTIGAGGGSIVWIDEGGALRVGPESAGADPGPACYGRGGEHCTVTDANLVLGLINPGGLLGGKLALDRTAANNAISKISTHFGVDASAAAEGIYRVVNANMAAAIRQVTVEKGIDPRDFALLPFGGAGGQHAVVLASEVGIPEVIVPTMPSVFSAFGMVSAPFKISRSRTVMFPLNQTKPDQLKQVFDALESEVNSVSKGAGREAAVQFVYALDLRYVKQAHEITVQIDRNFDKDQIVRAFEQRHFELYGTRLGHEILVVTARLTALAELPLLEPERPPSRSGPPPKPIRWASIVGMSDKVPVIDRRALAPGMDLTGPCLVEEVDTCVYLPPKSSGVVDQFANLVIRIPASGGGIDAKS